MMDKSYVGSVVRSLAGRDAKRIFVILAEERSADGSEYAWLADGRLRKLEKPKYNKRRHLLVLSEADTALADRIRDGSLTNRALHAYLQNYESMTHEDA